MSEHTQGPWAHWLDEDENKFKVYSDPANKGYGKTVAEIVGTWGCFEANARLIAAAPELLAACELVMRDLSDLEQHWKNESESFDHPSEAQEKRMALENLEATRRTIARVRTAIAKARTAAAEAQQSAIEDGERGQRHGGSSTTT